MSELPDIRRSIATAADNAICWHRPPTPFPFTWTVVSPAANRHIGLPVCELSSITWRSAVMVFLLTPPLLYQLYFGSHQLGIRSATTSQRPADVSRQLREHTANVIGIAHDFTRQNECSVPSLIRSAVRRLQSYFITTDYQILDVFTVEARVVLLNNLLELDVLAMTFYVLW